MKTGYFNQIKKGVVGSVSIAVGKPRYVKVEGEFKALAPTWALLTAFRNEEISEAQYVERFNAQLSKLNAREVVDAFHAMDVEPVIMCHCGQKDFCHRHLVAEWIERETGVVMEEALLGKVVRKDGRIVDVIGD